MLSTTHHRLAGIGTFALSGVIAVTAFFTWLGQESLSDMAVRLPGNDGRPATVRTEEGAVDFTGVFQTFDGTAATLPGTWPRFRGANFDNIAAEAPTLADSWGPDGPPVLWTTDLGSGYAGPVVQDGRVYVLDYDEETRSDALRCFSLENGKEIWRHAYSVEIVRNHGMSRTVPAVADGYVVSIGPRCHVLCLDAQTGALQWGIDLQREYETEEPLWYTGQCPLIDNGQVILAPGGPDALLMAVALDTGKVIWKTPNPMGWKMSHSSIMPITIAERRMYVYTAIGGVAGIAADREDKGALLWQVPWDAKIVAPSPIAIGDNRILALAGYGAGGLVLEVNTAGDGFEGREVSRHGTKDSIAAEQHTPIVHDGLIYSIMPKDAGALRAQFVCYRPDGTLVWSSGQENRFGLGPWLLADNKFYVLDDDGVLYLLRVSKEQYELLDKAKVLQDHESWAPMALAHNRLLVRDMEQMACLDVGVQ